jgi:Tfp pilus assembly protein PilF
VQIALLMDEDDRCDEAMPIFDQATREYPQDYYAWAGRGECLVKLNDLPRAEESLRRAFGLSHDSRIAEQIRQVRQMRGLPGAPN